MSSANVFLGVGLSDEERHALAAALTGADLARLIPGKRTRPSNWHITVRFVGPATDSQIDRLAERIEALLDSEPGKVWLSGLGAFPRFSKASVLHVAVDDPNGVLDELAAAGEEAATDVGFEPESRPYVPHLTLSRIRPVRDLSSIADVFDGPRIPISVDAVILFQTRSTTDGPDYVPLHRFPLRR
jgi:RNA 2',3'-cyclic 3'-phosphodiesterase